MDQALATVVAAHGRLDMARHWGFGTTASSDGQFFPAARQGEAMNTVNAKYGNDPGTKSYTSVNDQYAPFASRLIPVTASEAPYILSGLLANDAGRQIREQYADTAGYTDHVFGMSGLLDRRLVLRIRDLPSKRLYVFDPAATPTELRKLVAGRIREDIIVTNWPDLFRANYRDTAFNQNFPRFVARYTGRVPTGGAGCEGDAADWSRTISLFHSPIRDLTGGTLRPIRCGHEILFRQRRQCPPPCLGRDAVCRCARYRV